MAATNDRGHWLGSLGVAIVTVGLGLAAGVWGVLAGLAISLAWYLLPAAYTFAAGQLLTVATVSADAPLLAVAVAEFGLFTVLAGPLTETDDRGAALAAFAVAALALGAVSWGVLRTGRPLWTATLTVIVVAATGAYGLHRYERVRLGLVAGEPPEDGRRDGLGEAREEVV